MQVDSEHPIVVQTLLANIKRFGRGDLGHSSEALAELANVMFGKKPEDLAQTAIQENKAMVRSPKILLTFRHILFLLYSQFPLIGII